MSNDEDIEFAKVLTKVIKRINKEMLDMQSENSNIYVFDLDDVVTSVISNAVNSKKHAAQCSAVIGAISEWARKNSVIDAMYGMYLMLLVYANELKEDTIFDIVKCLTKKQNIIDSENTKYFF